LRTRPRQIAAHGEISVAVFTERSGRLRNLESIDHVSTRAKLHETTRLLAGFFLATEIVQI
jgi:hypothetical protein